MKQILRYQQSCKQRNSPGHRTKWCGVNSFVLFILAILFPLPFLNAQTNLQYSTIPVQVEKLDGVTQIAAGWYHNLAVVSNGVTFTWGYNRFGQVGDGTTINRFTPLVVNGLGPILNISAGGYHSVAKTSGGTLQAWGYNGFGQLGNGSTIPISTVPLPVKFLEKVNIFASGGFHNLAGTFSASVGNSGWSWGNNGDGQLGDGSTISKNVPFLSLGHDMFRAVAGGGYHSLIVKSDGRVCAFGKNDQGQLGNGSTTSQLTPIVIPGLSGIVAVSASVSHSLALTSDGTVWAFGGNAKGQLGDGTTVDRLTPIQVPNLSGVIAIAAGVYHSLALLSNGTVRAWGYNSQGQLGDGSRISRLTPVLVANLVGVVAISAGAYHSLALKSNGTAWTWGNNLYGQLGVGRGYTIIDLGIGNGPSDINNNGEVAGTTLDRHLFYWSAAKGIVKLEGLEGLRGSAVAINHQTMIVGGVKHPNSSYYTLPAFWNIPSGNLNPNILPLLPGHIYGQAVAINDLNHIVGECDNGGVSYQKACFWKDGTVISLHKPEDQDSEAKDINRYDQVVGTVLTSRGYRGFFWENGVRTDIGSLGGGQTGDITFAFAINDVGQVVGTSRTGNGLWLWRPFIWTKTQGMKEIPGSESFFPNKGPSEIYADADDINSHSQVVGQVGVWAATSPSKSFYWDKNKGMVDLNNLLPPNSGWQNLFGASINDSGQIVGTGIYNGEPNHGFVMTP